MTATNRTTWCEPVDGHVRPDDFRHRAACRAVDVGVFFPTAVHGRKYQKQVSVAKAFCAGCAVLPECLTWSLSALPDGIAGGMTEHERRHELARRRGRRRGRLPRPRIPQRPAGVAGAEVAHAGRAAVPADITATPSATDVAEGSAGGNRAPLLISHSRTQAGTRAEGPDRR